MEERENNKVRELMELLAKEQTLIGQYHGHSGQQKEAERRAKYWESVLAKMDDMVEEHIKAKWMRHKEREEARAKYHAKMAEEAKKELEEVRRRIKEILGGERE